MSLLSLSSLFLCVELFSTILMPVIQIMHSKRRLDRPAAISTNTSEQRWVHPSETSLSLHTIPLTSQSRRPSSLLPDFLSLYSPRPLPTPLVRNTLASTISSSTTSLSQPFIYSALSTSSSSTTTSFSSEDTIFPFTNLNSMVQSLPEPTPCISTFTTQLSVFDSVPSTTTSCISLSSKTFLLPVFDPCLEPTSVAQFGSVFTPLSSSSPPLFKTPHFRHSMSPTTVVSSSMILSLSSNTPSDFLTSTQPTRSVLPLSTPPACSNFTKQHSNSSTYIFMPFATTTSTSEPDAVENSPIATEMTSRLQHESRTTHTSLDRSSTPSVQFGNGTQFECISQPTPTSKKDTVHSLIASSKKTTTFSTAGTSTLTRIITVTAAPSPEISTTSANSATSGSSSTIPNSTPLNNGAASPTLTSSSESLPLILSVVTAVFAIGLVVVLAILYFRRRHQQRNRFL
ncbi:hypothetical protein BJ912DRAFT_220777 [Pholiota molesta]|nr:hypothetical protein BJ912DRAFT_220777 [Pholiota molesta]